MRTVNPSIPTSVRAFASMQSILLDKRQVRRVRAYALVLTVPVGELLQRRRHVFDGLAIAQSDYGFDVSFSRGVAHSVSRSVSGQFSLLCLSEDTYIVLSCGTSEENEHGAKRFIGAAYPLAFRPIISSAAFAHLVEAMEEADGWDALSVDAYAIDRETLRTRRDTKIQPVLDTVREMDAQSRAVSRLTISFREHKREVLRANLGRDCSVVLLKGDMNLLLERFMIPALERASDVRHRMAVVRAERLEEQHILALRYGTPVFPLDDVDAMLSSVVGQRGLGVTTLNWDTCYYAQVLDVLSGCTIDVLVPDEYTLWLLPRTDGARATIERVVSAIVSRFGDGDIHVIAARQSA